MKTVQLVLEKSTKNKYRFQEVFDNTNNVKDFGVAAIGTLYISKDTFEGRLLPQRITVTIDVVA
jgi:hypothetical protein